jgi:hypothetical protein
VFSKFCSNHRIFKKADKDLVVRSLCHRASCLTT